MKITKEQLKQIIKEELDQIIQEKDLHEIFGMFKSKEEPRDDLLAQLEGDLKLYADTNKRMFHTKNRTDAGDISSLAAARTDYYGKDKGSIFKMHPDNKEQAVLARIEMNDKDFANRWATYRKNNFIYRGQFAEAAPEAPFYVITTGLTSKKIDRIMNPKTK